jgi:hypothetical protein
MKSRDYFLVHSFLLGLLLLTAVDVLSAKDFLVEEDLRLNWVFFDEQQNVMLPFLDNSRENPVAIHLMMNKDYGEASYLLMDIPSGVSLFVDGKFIRTYEEPQTRLFSVDSIKNQFDTRDLKITLYRKASFRSPVESKIGFIHNSFDSTLNVNPVLYRDADSRIDFLKLIILIIFTFFVVLHTLFRADLLEFFSLQSLFTFRLTTTAFLKYRSLTKIQIMVIFFFSALLSAVVITYLYYYNNPFANSFLAKTNPIIGWLILFALAVFFIFLKFVLISVVSTLFKVPEGINFYLIEFLRMAMIFYSVVFVFLTYIVINHFYLVEALFEKLIMAVAIFYSIRFIILYFKFRRIVSMKNLHLFSYLCTTELIPIILGLKFFIK